MTLAPDLPLEWPLGNVQKWAAVQAVCGGACSARPIIQAMSGFCTHAPCHCQREAPSPGIRQVWLLNSIALLLPTGTARPGCGRCLASQVTRAASCLQGCGQVQAGLVNNWGDGFVTDPAVLAAAPGASDPNPFFQSLMGKPYLDQVVIAPHVYPPSITNNPKLPASGPELYMRLSRWGQECKWWPRQLVLA